MLLLLLLLLLKAPATAATGTSGNAEAAYTLLIWLASMAPSIRPSAPQMAFDPSTAALGLAVASRLPSMRSGEAAAAA
jgi:hypothetical protein